MQKKVVIYTAISQGYDIIKDPSFVSKDCDYICFSDKFHKSSVWSVRNFPEELNDLDQVRKCRKLKILPHRYLKEYDYSIWIDGNINIVNDVMKIINKELLDNEKKLLTFEHPYRNCIYDEALECIAQKKDSKSVIEKQVNKYRLKNMPTNLGLVESNVIVRKHNDKEVISLAEAWWNEIDTESRRDQLSFNYVVWKTHFKYDLLSGNSRGSSQYFELGKHKKTYRDIFRFLNHKLGIKVKKNSWNTND